MSSRHRTEKVSLSFSNWVLGGSLVSVKSVETPPSLPVPRRTARKMVIVKVDADGNEILPINLGIRKSKDGSFQGDKKGGGDDKKEEKTEAFKRTCNTCKTCKGQKPCNKKQDNDTLPEPEFDSESKTKSSNCKQKNDKSGIQSIDQIDRSGGWTETQDETILNMKDANKSWKEIAAEVGATKKEVTERFKLLQKYAEALFSNDSGQSEGGGGKTGKSEEQNGNGGNGEFDWSGIFGGDDARFWNNDDLHDDDKAGKNQNRKQDSKNSEQKKGNKQHQQQQQYHFGRQYEKHQPDENGSSGGRATFKNATQRQQKGTLHPDLIWDRDACELLEFLEAKHEEGKWMNLQAGFYNWTGRMVSAELIEKKFRDDGAGSMSA